MTDDDWRFLARVLDDWIEEGFVPHDAPEAGLAAALSDSIKASLPETHGV